MFFFFFNDTATTEIYTLSLHDALPISALGAGVLRGGAGGMLLESGAFRRRALRVSLREAARSQGSVQPLDRKSTRLNSSHGYISYAVFCLKKKKEIHTPVVAMSTTWRM